MRRHPERGNAVSKKGTRQRRRLKTPPPSGRKPSLNLAPRDVEAMAEELVAYHREFHDLFQRREQREWSQFYLRGQLAELERKTIEPMVLALKGADRNAVRAGQHFIGAGNMDDEAMLQRHQALVAETLGDPDGVVIVDGSGFPKQGQHSVGVARQYCGVLGKVANCQEGVFAVYAGPQGYTFLDRRLYLPESWFAADHTEHWQQCGIPETVEFQSEPALALEMLQGLVERGAVPFRWVTADERFGRDPAFLDGISALERYYLAEVPVTTRSWRRPPPVEAPGPGKRGRPRVRPRVAKSAPKAQEARRLAADLPASAWKRYTIKEGSKGPIVAEFAFQRVTLVRKGLPGPRAWMVFRRSLGPKRELKVYVSNAPANCAHSELVRRSGWRWPVESAFEEGKGEVGLDHYETRTWHGWHRHMTQTFLAHHFLVRMRVKLKKRHRP